MKRLPTDLFKLVVAHTPLVSIDLVVRNARGDMLLGLRRNRPAQGYWFAPGGRIGKDERLADAFRRITCEELGVAFDMQAARLLGVFEHLYGDNFSADPTFGTHYIVVAHELRVADDDLHLPELQHSHYRWLSDAEILGDDSVHENTKAYARLGGPAVGATG